MAAALSKALANKRDTEAYELRVFGMSYPKIAAKLNYASPSNAQQGIERYLKKHPPDPELQTKMYHRIQARFEMMIEKLLPQLDAEGWMEKASANKTILSITNSQMKLLGLGQENVSLDVAAKAPLRIMLSKQEKP